MIALSRRCGFPPPLSLIESRPSLDGSRSVVAYELSTILFGFVGVGQAEYVAPDDQRRHFVSGFTGSAGTAVVTATAAALWTDGRYFLQAEDELDCNWILMKQGQSGVSHHHFSSLSLSLFLTVRTFPPPPPKKRTQCAKPTKHNAPRESARDAAYCGIPL